MNWAHLAENPFTYLIPVLLLFFIQRIWSLTRPRLCFSEFATGDDAVPGPEPAARLRALTRVEVHRLAAIAQLPDGRPLRFDLAGPYDDHYDLGSLSDGLPPVWKQVVTLLGLMISGCGSKARVVTGVVLPQEQVVLGIETIHGGVRRTDTLRAEDVNFFPDQQQDGLARLALPSAAWIILEGYPGATLGGTPDWRSYITFAAAHAWQNRGGTRDGSEARRLYARACQDPRNTAAAVNLAALEQLDEREAGTEYPDPAQRPSARRLARVVDLTAERRAADPQAAASSPDLQWFRARYLLSSSLRDDVDRWRASTGRHAAIGQGADEQASEDAASAALGYAAELAIALEDERANLPSDFIRFGRAAALTLVARQAFPPVTSTSADQIAVAGQDLSDFSEAGLRAALRSLRDGKAKPGTAERLVRYVRTNLPTDDQTEYNMVWYQLTRARILRTAFGRWDGALNRQSGPDQDEVVRLKKAEYRGKVQRWQQMLARQYVIAEREARASRARVERGADPILIGLLPSLVEEAAARPALDLATRMRTLARESEGLDVTDPDDLEPPEENPDFTPSAPPEVYPTGPNGRGGRDRPSGPPPDSADPDSANPEASPRRRPDSPDEAAPDEATTRLLADRTAPVPAQRTGGLVVSGNGAGYPAPYREELPRWRRWLRRLTGRSRTD
jgi:hypothetical protein